MREVASIHARWGPGGIDLTTGDAHNDRKAVIDQVIEALWQKCHFH